ncbi:cbb3-type cytochrome c oxidase N-terminal domain-containing protein [Fluviicola sp.]|uniref:cbb3-type cytochrome c oxidase N-terminal domain-containing protein n=1 Tax=Fluviicola sp. TaxID=1917219 RepID=UPI003D27E4ED
MRIGQLLTLAALFLAIMANSQGEALFKAKCNTCHAVDKNSTGPWLKGVKAKWADAGEGELLYDWVRNSNSLIAGGKSKMALAIKDFSASEMPPQQASNEEVDQILDYVDNYAPPVKTAEVPGDPTQTEVELLPDYKGNLNIFYALGTLMIILLLAIILMSSSILSFVKSDLFKKKLRDQENLTKFLIIIISLGAAFVPGYSYGMGIPDPTNPAEVSYPWLLVEKVDLYILVGINLVLLMVVLYLRGLFNNFYYMVYPRKLKAAKPKQKRVVKILVDAVPLEEESSILMDHEYDGIRELDNNLPPWWVWGFYLTIVFAFVYLLYYHVFDGNTQKKEYDISIMKAQKEIDAYLKEAAMNVDESNVTLLNGQAALNSGKQIFEANCKVCHKDGSGDIGPNLTDKFWLYGNDIKTVFGTIKNGTSNGMPEHASKLNPIQLQEVASYVLSLKYIPGKEPQGKEFPAK